MLFLICGSNAAALLLARGASRQKEIAVRLALGPRPADVLRIIMGWTLRGVAIGSACAVALLVIAALAFRRPLQPIFNGLNPLDVPSLAAGLLVLAVTIGIAAYLPAHRALGTTPLEALRRE